MKQTITKLIDDLDGGDAAETVEFALDGVRYEIDLSAVNVKQIRELLTRYVDAGRKQGRVAVLKTVPVAQTSN